MTRSLWTALLFYLSCHIAQAQTVTRDTGPPDVPGAPDSVNPTFNHALVSKLRLGNLTIVLETTKLTDLARRFPQSHIYHRGDAAGSLTWACYTIDRASGSLHVWLDSGEIEGGNSISGAVVSTADAAPRVDCPKIAVDGESMGLDNGLWLGATKSSVLSRLGKPSRVYQTTLSYYFDAPTADKSKNCSTDGDIDFEIQDGRVYRIWANRFTSC
jgi:hypothetical protein